MPVLRVSNNTYSVRLLAKCFLTSKTFLSVSFHLVLANLDRFWQWLLLSQPMVKPCGVGYRDESLYRQTTVIKRRLDEYVPSMLRSKTRQKAEKRSFHVGMTAFSVSVVGSTGFEPVTSSVSMKRSTPEPTALACLRFRQTVKRRDVVP